MKKRVLLACLATALLVAAVVAASALAASILVTNGSPPGYFSHNKQNEPAVAVDQDTRSSSPPAPTTRSTSRTATPATRRPARSHRASASRASTSPPRRRHYTQPTYTGYTARQCNFDPPGSTCTPGSGPIGTLPRYFEAGLVSDGDPALAFGPQPNGSGGFTYANGSRLYYANLTSNFSAERSESAFKGFEAVAVSRLDTQDFGRALAGDNTAWKAPVIVTKQNAALFSDKEQIWADNVSRSPFFGNVYLCNASFRGQEKGNAAPEPILFVRSTNGGDTWSNPKQLTAATNNRQTGGRQGCAVRTDSAGVVYVYFEGFDKQRASAVFQTRSIDGGVRLRAATRGRAPGRLRVARSRERRRLLRRLAGARTDSFPSVDIANGAPTGADASNEIVMTYCDGPTPSDVQPGPNERATVQLSVDRGASFHSAGSASPPSDRRTSRQSPSHPTGRTCTSRTRTSSSRGSRRPPLAGTPTWSCVMRT